MVSELTWLWFLSVICVCYKSVKFALEFHWAFRITGKTELWESLPSVTGRGLPGS